MIQLKSTVVIAAVMVASAGWSYERSRELDKVGSLKAKPLSSAPPCIKLYDHLRKYSKRYNVPFRIALGVAKKETSYGGPFDWHYDPAQTSSANAYGAMQVQVPTAGDIWGRKVSKKELLNNLEFNVHTSMKLLSKLHKRYGSWEVALGCYNTGRPIVNGYAKAIANGKLTNI
jgi:soluble lytic murein transglycosylase-like protein